MDLDSMTYADLRQLAKSVGLKANMKAVKLLQALKRHFEQQGNGVASDDAPIPEEAAAEPEPATDALVTTRRRKKQQAKRKYSGNSADSNPAPAQCPVQDDAKRPGEKADGAKRSSKRRKVSSAPEVKPEPADDAAITEESQKDVVKKTAGKIPRLEGLMKKKKAALRPTTPNFKKLHEAHFNKMESIDSYVQRKNKQVEVLWNSVKDLKAQSENTLQKSADPKTRAKPPVSRASLFSPGAQEKEVRRDKVAKAPVSKPVIKDSAPFKPSILSTSRINFSFSQTTLDNEHKCSLVKTPARMFPMRPLTPTPGRKTEVQANKKPTSVNKTPGAMPFIFSGSCSTPTTNKKNGFDLKASLSRPLTYKPHKGKLKPFGVMQENGTLNNSQTLPTRTNYKQHKVQTRDKRREKHVEDRKQKKEMMLGARRGLVLA